MDNFNNVPGHKITEFKERLSALLPGEYSLYQLTNKAVLRIKYSNNETTITIDIPMLMVATLDYSDMAAIVIEEVKKAMNDPNFTMNKLMGRK